MIKTPCLFSGGIFPASALTALTAHRTPPCAVPHSSHAAHSCAAHLASFGDAGRSDGWKHLHCCILCWVREAWIEARASIPVWWDRAPGQSSGCVMGQNHPALLPSAGVGQSFQLLCAPGLSFPYKWNITESFYWGTGRFFLLLFTVLSPFSMTFLALKKAMPNSFPSIYRNLKFVPLIQNSQELKCLGCLRVP